MNSTIVKMTCLSKKEIAPYTKGQPTNHEIELAVAYDQTSVFYRMSGGTNIVLRTINQEAAAMFQLNGEYMLNISPAIAEVPGVLNQDVPESKS